MKRVPSIEREPQGISRYKPELLALPLLPLLGWQGQRTRARALRLPGPEDDPHGLVPGTGQPLSLLMIGESPVAGIGVSAFRHGLACAAAHEINAVSGRPVKWRALGANGATVADAIALLVPQVEAESLDVLCLAFGVNDSTAFRSASRFRADLLTLLDAVAQRLAAVPALTLLSGAPPLAQFPLLPWPLRAVLGQKARVLDLVQQQVAWDRTATLHVPLPGELTDPGLMAEDGYHPSAAGCRVWAQRLAAAWLEGQAPLAGRPASRNDVSATSAPGFGG